MPSRVGGRGPWPWLPPSFGRRFVGGFASRMPLVHPRCDSCCCAGRLVFVEASGLYRKRGGNPSVSVPLILEAGRRRTMSEADVALVPNAGRSHATTTRARARGTRTEQHPCRRARERAAVELVGAGDVPATGEARITPGTGPRASMVSHLESSRRHCSNRGSWELLLWMPALCAS